MCAAIDMLSSEQHFYGVSPPAGFLSDYTPPIRRLTTRGFSAPCLPVIRPFQINFKTAPRSCLRAQTKKTEKKVVFADDRGYALEQVRFMSEPSHLPPYWAMRIATSPPIERKPPLNPPVDVWEIKFKQPASDYLEFRKKITEDCVSLENVMVKHREGALDGTVKVKNLDFMKEVFVRTTADGWRTHEDTYCEFLETIGSGRIPYDTFAFSVPLPIHSRRMDFCVCFKCLGNEYWDNNGGSNYTVEKSSVKCQQSNSSLRVNSGNSWNAKKDMYGNTPYW